MLVFRNAEKLTALTLAVMICAEPAIPLYVIEGQNHEAKEHAETGHRDGDNKPKETTVRVFATSASSTSATYTGTGPVILSAGRID